MKKSILLTLFVLAFFGLATQATAISVTSVTKITQNGHFSDPQWSPGGTKIYASGENGSIVVMNADGSGLKTLHPGDGYSRHFTVSPDGSKILYEYSETENFISDLWVMNSDGTNKSMIVASAFSPDWAPDGTIFCYVSSGKVWVSGVDGTNKKVVINGSEAKFQSLSMILAMDLSGDNESVFIINLQGAGKVLLFDGFVFDPYYSDLDNKFYYRLESGYERDIVSTIDDIIIQNASLQVMSNNKKFMGYIVSTEDSDTGSTLTSKLVIVDLSDYSSLISFQDNNVYLDSLSWKNDDLAIAATDEGGDVFVIEISQ